MKSSFRFKFYMFVLFLVHIAVADIYLHNPRGGNNRLDEEGRNVKNNKRLFNSQNNNRGGNNVGSLYYYAGSTLQIEWTNQHSCAGPNNNCELVIQYMCGDLVRDGATTDTIPVDNEDCRNFNCNTDFEYGMNEDEKYYRTCAQRIRNKGLFTAGSFLGKRAKNVHARFTRQNPNGNRYGFECQEERDYYPYWQSSPWKDIVVMTNDVSRCPYYTGESQNVKSRWECVIPDEVMKNFYEDFDIPNNEADCQAFNHEGHTAQWTEIPAHGIPAPDCRETEYSRDNHNGNGLGGQPNVYNWTIPHNINHEQCVLRMRYNISTNDFDSWTTDSASNPNKIADFHSKYGFATRRDGIRRGYFLRGNPKVQLFPDLKLKLQLAINLAQYGRTFQDRSFAFAVRTPPSEAVDKTIHNLNVRGKRGNLVQTYPSVEYDFVPNKIEAGVGEFIHIQWTGSNTNNANNAGNGQARTDRSNIILLGPQVYREGSGVQFGPAPKFGHYGVNYPMHLDNGTFLGFSRRDGVNLAFNGPGTFGGELSQLDDSGPYYDLDLRTINKVGTFHYVCTRNNDFTNRDQKGRISVTPYPVIYQAIGAMGGEIGTNDNSAIVRVDAGTFSKLNKLKLVEMSQKEGMQLITSKGGSMNVGTGYASNFYILSPETKLTEDNGKKIRMIIALDNRAASVSVFGSNTNDLSNWVNLNAVVKNGYAEFEVEDGGVAVARTMGQPT